MKRADQAGQQVEECVGGQHGQRDAEQCLQRPRAVDLGCVIEFLRHVLQPGQEDEHANAALDGHEDEDPFDHHRIAEPSLAPGEAKGFEDTIDKAEGRAPDKERHCGGAGHRYGAGHDRQRAKELEAAHFDVEQQRLQEADHQSARNGDTHVEQRVQQRFASIGVFYQIYVVADSNPLGGLENVVNGEAVVERVEDWVGLKNEYAQDPREDEDVGQRTPAEVPAFCLPAKERSAPGGIQAWLFCAQTGGRHTDSYVVELLDAEDKESGSRPHHKVKRDPVGSLRQRD